MRACRQINESLKTRRRSVIWRKIKIKLNKNIQKVFLKVDIGDVNISSPKNSVKSFKSVASIYNSDLDKLIKENKDSYFLKILIQDNIPFNQIINN